MRNGSREGGEAEAGERSRSGSRGVAAGRQCQSSVHTLLAIAGDLGSMVGLGYHLPHCFRSMVNRRIEELSALTEHSCRPQPWSRPSQKEE